MNHPPLAERLRPKTLSEYVGQSHLIGDTGQLSIAIKNKLIPSMILWGPPGVGKTSLALLIAEELKRPFYTLSAINSGVKEIREVIAKAESQKMFQTNGAPLLFIDEIHRFSKSQQDSLLGAVEKGIVTLIGATTENPSFEVISALLSRCQVYVLKPFTKENLEELLDKALNEDEILHQQKINLKESDALLAYSGGDARKLLNNFELIINGISGEDKTITNEVVKHILSQNPALYDKGGEQHYDIISAFIKSIRGSDPNAALYWLARMVAGGEDPKFIARRLILAASEDIGNANPNALMIATECFKAVEVVGYPECELILAQATTFLASSPKSNSSYLAIKAAKQLVQETGDLPVPLPLRNAPSKLMKQLDYGVGYKYPHDFNNHFTPQQYMPDLLQNKVLYQPGDTKREQDIKRYLNFCWPNKYPLK